MPIEKLSHIGICVAELDRSTRFYCEGLGFEEIHRIEVAGPEAATLLDLEGVQLEAVYLERDGTVIELLHYPTPGHVAHDGPRPMNRPGLTHLSFRVNDFDTVIASLEALGGRVLKHTESRQDAYDVAVVFMTDPDGTRIEILQSPVDPTRPRPAV